MDIISVLTQYKWVISFYLAIILLLVIKRKNVVIQAKVIVLYRTLLGIKFIRKIAERYREWVKLFGYVGIGVGFLGLIVISIIIILSLVQLFTRPEQASNVQLVLPGLEVPGLGVLTFWHWIFAIFIIAVVHEFAHGIVAHAHRIKVNWTGLVLIGPIIGAFVEPNENKLAKSHDTVQYSVYAAGAWANILLAIAALLITSFILVPIQQPLIEPVGFTFEGYYNNSYPAERAGLLPGELIRAANNQSTLTFSEFANIIEKLGPNEPLQLTTQNRTVQLITTASPTDPQQGFIGITNIRTEMQPVNQNTSFLVSIVGELITFFQWLWVLSLSIGLFNLLPLPIVDGGRMAQTFLKRRYGELRGNKFYGKVGLFFLFVLVAILAVSFLRWVVG